MLRLTTFESDITPPIGHPLCAGWYPPASAVETPLSALGLVFVPDDDLPMVLCALDWAELSNGDYDCRSRTRSGPLYTRPRYAVAGSGRPGHT